MNSLNDTDGLAVPATGRTGHTHRLSGADTATVTALLGLHLVPATVMIPTLARSLRTRACAAA
jgi:hypothetical protein